MAPQPDPHDLVDVQIDDELVIAAPRGYEDEVRAVFAADPTLWAELLDQRRRLARGRGRDDLARGDVRRMRDRR